MKRIFFCHSSLAAKFQKYLLLPAFSFLLTVLLIGCEEDAEKPRLRLGNLSINGQEITITDSVYFIQGNDAVKLIQISTAPTDAFLYYSVNGADYRLNSTGTVQLNTGDSLFRFYHVMEGFKNSEIHTILFTPDSKRFLQAINIYPNPSDSIVYIEAADKSRGQIECTITTLTGIYLYHDISFKASDSLSVIYNGKDLADGLYVIKLTYGGRSKGYKFIINS